jgi:FtsP/CotA-like multicopper oxidase with cupredoxin domain
VQVPAANALNKAHALAIERLIAQTTDPVARSSLRAVEMKLDTIEAADLGTAARLANSVLVGTYFVEAGPGASVTVLEKDGQLIQHVDGFPDAALAFVKGNRYHPAGMPDGTYTSFRVREGKTELLLEVTFGPPTIREKR